MVGPSNKDFEKESFLWGNNSVYLEEIYNIYKENPNDVSSDWKEYFESLALAPLNQADTTLSTVKIVGAKLESLDKKGAKTPDKNAATNSNELIALKAQNLIEKYRSKGHFLASLDPLKLEKISTEQEVSLSLKDFEIAENIMHDKLTLSPRFKAYDGMSLNEIYSKIRKDYSKSIAYEIDHIEYQEEKDWFYSEIESGGFSLKAEEQQKLLSDLAEVEGFEQFLHTKFPGAKRFSVEGGDLSVICTDMLIEFAARKGYEDMVLGMAHRGRLSTLTKVMKKPYRAVISEFKGNSAFPEDLGISGDVKYHMGYSSDRKFDDNKIHLSLTPNPSHLEAVNTVAAGKVRAKQDLIHKQKNKAFGIIVHGDAAFGGQGVVAEGLMMSGLDAYDVGGLMHIVVNNQIGFTTDYSAARKGRYATDFALLANIPIIHVCGDDAESVVKATRLGFDYKAKFGRDIVIDIVCYRKYGHNEGDEPFYTQSVMYNVIKQKETPAKIYADKLQALGVIDENYYENCKTKFKAFLEEELKASETYKPEADWLKGEWSVVKDRSKTANTGYDKKRLLDINTKLNNIPNDFDANPKLVKLLAGRIEMLNKEKKADWAIGEQLAFASILDEGVPIRFSGQDVQRGTFSHRHAVLKSGSSDKAYTALNNFKENQAKLNIFNSNLSEFGVLGFEYGYSLTSPKQLVIWEAQFGDFCNGAQIIFDQFISSAMTKWLRLSGIVILLPHGMEGQGPEHSSARLERFLQMAAENNMYITNPTTPSSIFHLLRRQTIDAEPKPLIVMSPKSLLRHKSAVSSLDEFDKKETFKPVIDENNESINAGKVQRVVFCSGKVYYDLQQARDDSKINDIAIVRLEQLYPYPKKEMSDIVKKYTNASEYVWAQEEPENMGAWSFINKYINETLGSSYNAQDVGYVGREAAASPATGYSSVHTRQQNELVKKALKIK